MKERLTGAILLVALLVLLVPELLTGPIRPTPHALPASGAATAAEEPPLRSYTISLGEDAHARGAERSSGPAQPASLVAAATVPAAVAPAAVQSDAPPVPSPAAHSPGTPAATAAARAPAAASPAVTAPAATAPGAGPASHRAASLATASGPSSSAAAGAGGAWVVQLGSFASRANAERLAKQLHGSGFQVSVSQGTSGRRLYRVRTSSAQAHEAALQLATRLRAAGHKGEVVPK